jgi:hypothetical protein
MSNLGQNFYSKLVQISSEVGMNPEDLIAVMISESGMNPSAVEKRYKGAGLIQFMPRTLKSLGFNGTWEDFIKLSGEDQLDYVKKYIEYNMKSHGVTFTSAAQYYVANLWPVALKLPGVKQGDLNTKIIEEFPERSGPNNEFSKKYFDLGVKIKADFESKAYKSNPLFDKEKKGAITYGDLHRQVQKNKQSPIYQKAIASMKSQTGYSPQAQRPATAIQSKENAFRYSNLFSMLNNFLKMILASECSNKSFYKLLPTNYSVIKISSKDYTDAVEFANVLANVLDEELMSRSFVHTDGKSIELECRIPGPSNECNSVINILTQDTVDAFKVATAKIGGIAINAQLIPGKKSYDRYIEFDEMQAQHNKFLIKFNKVNNEFS